MTHFPHNPPGRVALELRALCKRFGALRAVDDVSLELCAGEVLALLGPNGAGKTTLMRTICGLTRADAGSVNLPGATRPRALEIGYCPQALTLWGDLSPREQLVHMAEMYGFSRNDAKQRAEGLLKRFALEAKADTRADALSGGMARRTSVAMALVHDPAVVILDEPEVGLDPQSRLTLRNLITSLAKEDGRAVLLSTHDMDEAQRLADRVAIMDSGKLLALDTKDALLADAPKRVSLDLPPGQDLGDVERALANAGLARARVDVRAGTLEDVFIALTGRRLRE